MNGPAPAPLSPGAQAFSVQLTQLAQRGLDLAGEMEAGQAEVPFTEHFRALAREPGPAEPIRVILLGLEPESTHAALAYFLGQDYNLCKVAVPSRLGYAEVVLRDRGFVFDTGGEAREFESADPFIEALRDARVMDDPENPRWMDPLRLQMKALPALTGLCLLIPNKLDSLVEKPALLSALSDRADWLLLAGQAGSSLSPAQRQVIQLLLDNLPGLQCLLAGSPAAPAGVPAWAQGWSAQISLGLVALQSSLVGQRLSILLKPASELRRLVLETRRWHGTRTEIQLVQNELEEQLRRIKSRSRLAREGLTQEGSAGSTLRKAVEELRQQVLEELETLRQRQEVRLRQEMSPQGDLHASLQQLADRLEPADLERTEQGNAIRLTLAEEAQNRCREHLAGIGKTRLEVDCHELKGALSRMTEQLEAQLEPMLGARPRLTLEAPAPTVLWETLRAAVHPEIRYRGEMPRPSLATRFSAARQTIMGVMVLGMILGGVGTLLGGQEGASGLRTVLYALMLPLLLIGFIWTYVSFSRKEAEQLEREAEKLRETAFAEMRRVLAEHFRQEQVILQQAAQKAARDLQTQIARLLEQVEQLRGRELEEARRKQQEQARNADQRLRRVQQLQTRARLLADGLKPLDERHRQWLHQWVEHFNASPLAERAGT